MMKNIGKTMERALNKNADNPIVLLRNLIEKDRNQLQWLSEHRPEVDLSAKHEHLERLDSICRILEIWPPIEPWITIWQKLGEAKREGFNGDLALLYFPLKAILPPYHESRQVVIDLCGYDLDPRVYSLTGYFGRQFFTSGIND